MALACFALLRATGRVERMLVVAPLTAFAAWKDDAEVCFFRPPKVAVHLGPESALSATADIMLTNYHRLCSDYMRLQEWTASARTHIVLDEAHRVKRGGAGKHGRAALDMAYSGVRRDILTGTPTPQGPHDLVAMIEFLYPGQANQILPSCAMESRVDCPPSALAATNEAISRYFVRTRKSDLGLPPTQIELLVHPMGAVQDAIYSALVGRYRGSFALDGAGKHSLRKLGKIVMYLLEAATNPLCSSPGPIRTMILRSTTRRWTCAATNSSATFFPAIPTTSSHGSTAKFCASSVQPRRMAKRFLFGPALCAICDSYVACLPSGIQRLCTEAFPRSTQPQSPL
ncbi:MAG: hypothetical protein IPG61_10270 [bacterium]|nr:hypothetical protein [bacterium]